MPQVELYLDEADKHIQEGAFNEAADWLSRHLEEHNYSQEARMAVSLRLRDISERLMEMREFSRAFDFYDSYLNQAKFILSLEEHKNAIVFIVNKCKRVIDVQTGSNSFDIARRYFDRTLAYGRQLKDTTAYDGILTYIVEKHIEEMGKNMADRSIIEKLKREAERYIEMIADKGIKDNLKNRKIKYDDKTRVY